jgi:hypothetical protein
MRYCRVEGHSRWPIAKPKVPSTRNGASAAEVRGALIAAARNVEAPLAGGTHQPSRGTVSCPGIIDAGP